MRAFFVIAALAIAALAASGQVALDFEAGANLTNADADFSFRFQSFSAGSFFGFDVMTWTSASVDAKAANASAKATADAMIGAGVLPGVVNLPFAFLAYANGSAAVDTNGNDFLTNLFEGSLSATFKGGVIAMAGLGLQEIDGDDKIVQEIPLTTSLTKPCKGKELHGDDGNLNGFTCTYSPALMTSTDITVTLVTSKKAGIMKYGNTPVSPRSLEMIIEVAGFPLKDEKNHVRLNLGLLTASGAGSVDGSANIVHRDGQEDIYVAASEYAVIEGDRKEVKVTVKSGADGLDTKSKFVLNAALGGNIDAQIAHVDFPAGVTDFVYDPACGAGKDVYAAGASTIALSALVALVCALLYLF